MEMIIGYHGTTKQKAQSICESQFIINEDIENELYLGKGVYFYYNFTHAIEWILKMYRKENKNHIKYSELKLEYAIIEANIQTPKDRILDLDMRTQAIKFDRIVEKIRVRLINKPEYIKAKKKDAAVLNILQEMELISGVDIISKTFYEDIQYNKERVHNLGKIPKRMFCVKNINVIVSKEISNKLNKRIINETIYV